MSTENTNSGMSIEALLLKMENQNHLIKELTTENEQLYQQYSHLIIRNTKLLKRIDDLQNLIDSLHLRVEELQLVNDNMLKINDGIRKGNDISPKENDNFRMVIDALHKRIDDLNRRNFPLSIDETISAEDLKPKVDAQKIFEKWKNLPQQESKNSPNLKKQSQMLIHLYENEAMNSKILFDKTGIGSVTGARYIAALKKFNLISYTGARKNGHYIITEQGKKFIEDEMQEKEISSDDVTRSQSDFITNSAEFSQEQLHHTGL